MVVTSQAGARMVGALLAIVSAAGLAADGARVPAARQPAPPAGPVEAIGAIIEAFDTHAIVALGDVHGNEQSHAVRLALVRDPRFAARVNDIVVEFGNARLQPLMDGYIAGHDVADADLRHVWQDTTQFSGVWDRPIYGDFFRAVRDVNRSLPPAGRLRVWLADPPVDWDRVRQIREGPASGRDGMVTINGVWIEKSSVASLDRDTYAAQLVEREILDRRRRALLVFGDGHLQGRTGVVARLERTSSIEIFSIVNAVGETYRALEAERGAISAWPAPSLLRRTRAAADGPERADALLYLGPPQAMTSSTISAALCADAAYLERRRERMRWAGLPEAQAETLLARDCRPSR